jgi:hypothetical protein
VLLQVLYFAVLLKQQSSRENPQIIQSARLSIQSSELGPPSPYPQESVLPPTPGGDLWGETHSLAVERVGDPIQTTGKLLWYFRYTIILL